MSLPLVYHTDYVAPLPPAHRFPMPKFGQVYQRLVRDGIADPSQFHVPDIVTRAELERVHDPAFIDAYQNGTLDRKAMRRIGLPWSAALVTRTCTAQGGSILTARLAVAHGLACNTAGGTHHAHRDFGSGFCIFNDLAVAARAAQAEGLAARVLIVDLDVHQGDGSASIFADDASVFTFSMHCQRNFPFRKVPSDLDVPLPVGMEDAAYLRTLEAHLPGLLADVRPDLVLYDAGVDPHVDDRLGKLALSDEGLYQRDLFVIECCLRRGVPVACVIGGGYMSDTWQLAGRHCILHRAASDAFEAHL